MTKPRYPIGCSDGSQVCGDAGSSRSFFYVNMNNGNVNNNNANNRLRARPVRRVVPAGECQGEISLKELDVAYRAAQKKKRPSANQLQFDLHWIDRMLDLQDRINSKAWSPSPATCFVAQRPKARQIHAPDFGDRVVHHAVVPIAEAVYEPTFIFDSYGNRKGKGTHKAVDRVRQFVRQVDSGQGGGWYLQLDIRNFFNSIHRPTLYRMLKQRLGSAGVPAIYMHIIHSLLRHPVQRQGVIHRSTAEERARVPAHKRLENAAPGCGLPIGNLSSQFFANVYLDPLDQFVKHVLKAQRYVRYVDDFVLFHHDRAQLERWKVAIERFLDERLKLRLKDDIRLRPLSAGIDFLGYVVYPTHTRVRPRVVAHAKEALATWHRSHRVRGGFEATPADVRALSSTLASYEGHLRHANSHRLTARLRARHSWAQRFARPLRFDYRLEGVRMLFLDSKVYP